ncbi:MAG: hypothetical protein PXY39_14995 [archaeon]|nr:hypothetical protein [archaeon]
MKLSQLFRNIRNNNRKATSSIIGGIIILGMMLSVGYGYFMFVTQSEQTAINNALHSNLMLDQQNSEHMIVIGQLVGPAVGFKVTNMGVTSTIVSYFVSDLSTGQIDKFNTGGSSSPPLPYTIEQGQTIVFNSGMPFTSGHSYVMKLLTARGSTFVATYPPQQLNTKAISSLVAEGIGSISMVFSSYNFYSITSSGGKYIVGLSRPHSAALLPNGITPAFSLMITNNDPGVGTIVIDTHTDLWLYNVCPNGCGTVPLFTFYAVNVAPNGTITSTTQGSFSEISIPYGETQTVFFASANDLSTGNFQTITLSTSHNVALGEYDVFIIVSGSDSTSTNSVLYSQNLPFAGSFLADNVAWYSETPVTCTHSSPTTFSLTINNSFFSSYSIQSVSINAEAFNFVTATSPQFWSDSLGPPGVITWTSQSTGHNITPGSSLTFSWTGTAPSSVGTQSIFLITIQWNGGTISMQQSASGCYVS